MDRPVEPFNVGVVIRLPDTAVAEGNALRFELVVEPLLELRPIVGLEHGNTDAEIVLCPQGKGIARPLVAHGAVFGIGTP